MCVAFVSPSSAYVARNEAARTAMCDVDEAGTVDPPLRQPAPEVRRAEEAPGFFDRIGFDDAEVGLAHPARVVVGGADARPAVAPLLDANGLASE